ncbi:MAG TPA: GntR family transcriptional regulator [Longimicrobiaceae bacterium]|nr:GntR family transcriptional regulator [Longimicrobiaceae bacterium]
MQATIRTDDPRPIYQQIMDEVRRARVIGTLRPDEPLPSVRELAAELRVNPNTVALAYRELEREGLVYVQRGRGTFASPGPGPGEKERRALALDVARRALVDAHRNGIGLEELVNALNQVSLESTIEEGGGS